jgi:hypothetical protein
MSHILNTVLVYHLKFFGFLPWKFSFIGKATLWSSLITTLPFQYWKACELTDNKTLYMLNLTNLLLEIMVFVKFFILWWKRRFVKIIRLLYSTKALKHYQIVLVFHLKIKLIVL